jgi:predicted metal-binding protein
VTNREIVETTNKEQRMGKNVGKITLDMNAGRLAEDLERYVAKAIELGASKAKVVKADEIPVDERVTLKCRIPRCFGYGVSAHCPPHALKPAELRELLEKYKWAVLFVKDVPSEVIVRDKATIKERVAVYQEVFKIVSEVESMAFYDGHYLTFGFGAGSCRHTFCGQQKSCQAMEGERCRFSLISRPSMEAVGIDVYKMVTAAGWDIYPIGSNARPEDMPKGTLAGIVIVQ